MPKLIVDAMGGDHGPQAVLEGIVEALPELQSSPGELVIVGDEAIVRSYLGKRKYRPLANALENQPSSASVSATQELPFRVSLVHASQAIDMEDSIRAIRNKPNATINIGCQLAAQ